MDPKRKVEEKIVIEKLAVFTFDDIEKGNHDDEKCEEYCNDYKDIFGQEHLDCQFNKSKIQNLLQKVQIDPVGSVTEVKESMLSKMKNLFRRK